MEDRKKNFTINVVVLGDTGVGKTSFINRILGRKFDDNVLPTFGFLCETINFYNELEKLNVTIRIWDTAGQEKYRSTCAGIAKRADIIIIVRDNINDSIDNWLSFLDEKTDIKSEEVKMIFCLNKTDLLHTNEKNSIYEELLNKAQEYKASVYKFSSKNDNDFENIKLQIQNFSLNLIKNGLKTLKDEINICLIGPSMVGKTSIINRIINHDYIESTVLTTSLIKNYCFVDLKNHCDVKYNYYDIPGQEKYMKEELTPRIIKKIDIIIFVNDYKQMEISNKVLMQRLSNLKGKNIIFCINKSDLIHQGEIVKNEYIKINKPILGNNEPIFVSAKTNEGIEDLNDKISEFVQNKLNNISMNDDSSHLTSVTRPLHGVINLDDFHIEQNNKKFWEKFCDKFTSLANFIRGK
jgi:small GTP-binding protein